MSTIRFYMNVKRRLMLFMYILDSKDGTRGTHGHVFLQLELYPETPILPVVLYFSPLWEPSLPQLHSTAKWIMF